MLNESPDLHELETVEPSGESDGVSEDVSEDSAQSADKPELTPAEKAAAKAAKALAKAERAQRAADAAQAAADKARSEADADSVDSVPEAPRPPRRRKKLRIALAAVAAVVVAALVAGFVLAGAGYVHERRISDARTHALAAAKKYGADLATINYSDLDSWASRVTADLAPSFASDFQKLVAALKLEVAQAKLKSTSRVTARVIAAGTGTVTPNHAVVYVFIDQTFVDTTTTAGSELEERRAQFSLTRSHGKWLVSNFVFLSQSTTGGSS